MVINVIGAIFLNIWLVYRVVANSYEINGADLHALILSTERYISVSSALRDEDSCDLKFIFTSALD